MSGVLTSLRTDKTRAIWLLTATFLVAIAGLIYELLIATSSTFLLGDSVRQFSFVIGIFLTAMGIGSWLSRFVGRARLGFVWGQLALALVGGFSAPSLFLAFAYLGDASILLFLLLLATGILAGMEIPLIVRILEELGAKEFRFENVLSLDYAGALIASISFPILIMPLLGLVTSSLLFGAFNAAVAGVSIFLFWDDLGAKIKGAWCAVALVLLMGLISADRIVSLSDSALFEDDIIYSQTSPYQKIVVTKYQDRYRLYLNSSIQFDSLDEYRYHEMLVHPAMLAAPQAKRVLILGGGDGLVAKQVLKHHSVEQIDLVDLDPAVTQLFSDNQQLARLSDFALKDPKLKVINQDAWKYLEARLEGPGLDGQLYDLVIADLPDPKDYAISKLYTVEFYRLVEKLTTANAIIVTQAGSPTFSTEAFWSVKATLAEGLKLADRALVPYHAYLPSFGDWGFVLAAKGAANKEAIDFSKLGDLQFLNQDTWRASQSFAADIAQSPVEANRLTNHALVDYYLDGWAKWKL